MKRSRRKITTGLLILALISLLLSLPAGAKTVRAPKYGLKQVINVKAMRGHFVKVDGQKKFLRPNGTYLRNRWVKVGTAIHYMDKNGNKFKGWVIYRGHKYRVKSTGLVIGKLFTSGGKQYYANEKGYVATGWITFHGHRYYGGPGGKLLKGEHLIDGQWCYFKKNGRYSKNHTFKNKIDPSKPMIALTFDDGPGPYTNRLLDCLSRYNAHATFFMVGTSVPSWPGVIRRMQQLGCELGNHSNSHPQMSTLSASGVASEFATCTAKIRSACGASPTVCRLPYGNGHNVPSILAATGLPSIFWSVDTEDWKNTGNPQHTVNSALSNARNGAIILMHDIHASTVTACETIIPQLVARGYQLVTVSELARYKGHTALQAGRTYYNFY